MTAMTFLVRLGIPSPVEDFAVPLPPVSVAYRLGPAPMPAAHSVADHYYTCSLPVTITVSVIVAFATLLCVDLPQHTYARATGFHVPRRMRSVLRWDLTPPHYALYIPCLPLTRRCCHSDGSRSGGTRYGMLVGPLFAEHWRLSCLTRTQPLGMTRATHTLTGGVGYWEVRCDYR